MTEQENFDEIIQFEPDYELIKLQPEQIWFKYETKIAKLVNGLAWWKNFDKDELYQESYLFFQELAQNYDPFYMGRFYPFDRYVFKNLIIKLRAYIQRYYVKSKREKPSEYCEFLLQNETVDNIRDSNDSMFIDYVYSLLNDRQREILKLTLDGFKQQEIGKQLSISQSRVSVIKKKTIETLRELLNDKLTEAEKQELKITKLQETLYQN